MRIRAMGNVAARHDWLASSRTSALAWGIPHVVFALALIAPVPWRTAIWTITLAWMGVACILNSRRCGRTHCRYTGPYYLVMILPVLAIGAGVASTNFSVWLALGALILGGGMVIWWASERAWGQFSV